ncbi:MAG: YigZ family protein, partial [Chloroflexota bacterium]
MPHLIPASSASAEIEIQKSRFLARTGHVSNVDEAKAFLAKIKAEMPDANHHVYAYRIGHENAVIEGMSDDGEPSGTSGPPILAILRGTELGDVIVVVTRYFGGRKLGTGGLVRAYSDATRAVLEGLATTVKIAKSTLSVELPYHLYEPCKKLIVQHEGAIEAEGFATEVTVRFEIPTRSIENLRIAIRNASSGQVLLGHG